MIATLTSKGQVTVPKELREELHLRAGDKLDFVLKGNGAVEVVPLKQPASMLRGILPKPRRTVSVEQMNAAIAAEGSKSGRG